MGSLNARLGDPRDEREEELVMALVDRGLVSMTDYFLPRIQYWGAGGWIWSMQRDERQVTGRGDYILSTYRISLVNTGIRETHHGICHMLILAMLRVEEALSNRRGRQGRTCWPIRPKAIRPQTEGGGSLRGSQMGYLKYAAANKGVCVLNIPGDLEACRKKSGAPEGTASKRKGGQAGTVELPENLGGRQEQQVREVGEEIKAVMASYQKP